MSEQTELLNAWHPDNNNQYGANSNRGPVREGNEDACWVPAGTTPTELGELFIVADGVGGQQYGRDAADTAVAAISQVFYRLRQENETIVAALHEALLQANDAIFHKAQSRGVERMGSTVVAAVIQHNQLSVANVGDARGYLLRQGQLAQLTHDDTWVQRQVDAGMLTPADAAQHELRNVVTQVLGNKPEITVNMLEAMTLEDGDLILLCSDGLYDVLTDGQIIEIMTQNQPQEAAERLVQAAIVAEATDNITAVVARYGAAVAAPPLPSEQPTVVVAAQQPPQPPPAPAKKRSWLPLLAALAILVVILLFLLYFVFGRANVNSSTGAKEAATAVPAAAPLPAEPDSNEAPAVEPTTPAEVQPTATLLPTPTSTLTVSLETAVAPAEITIGSVVVVTGTGTDGLRIRSSPEIEGFNDVGNAPEGTRLEVLAGPEEVGEYRWWQVRTPNGIEGWAADEFYDLVENP